MFHGPINTVQVQLVRLPTDTFPGEVIFYRIFELMLPTLIQRYYEIILFLIQCKNERLTEILQGVRCPIL